MFDILNNFISMFRFDHYESPWIDKDFMEWEESCDRLKETMMKYVTINLD